MGISIVIPFVLLTSCNYESSKVQWSLYFKATQGAMKMSYIAGGLKYRFGSTQNCILGTN